MLTPEYIKENICRDLCDTIDKYGRGWQKAIDCIGDIIDTTDFFEDDGGIDKDQRDQITKAFRDFILTIDKVFDEIK